MTTPAPRRSDGWTFTAVPDRIADHPDCTPTREVVTRAILRAAASKGYATETRGELAASARVALGAVSQAIAWLVEIGEIRSDPDMYTRSRRRLVLLRSPTSAAAPFEETHQRLGAHYEVTRLAPGSKAPCTRKQHGARQESYPLYKEEIEEEKERIVPSRNSPGSPASDPIESTASKTGRDDCASLRGRGGEPTAPPAAEDAAEKIAKLEGELAAILAAIPDEADVRRECHRNARLGIVGLRRELEALRAPGRPAPRPAGVPDPRSLPRPAPAAPGPPRAAPGVAPGKSPEDESIRFLLGGPANAGLFAASLAALLGEPDNPRTLATLRDSAELLRPDWVAGRVRSALRPGVNKPANYLVRGLGKDLKLKRQTLAR